MERNAEYINAKWTSKTQIENRTYEGFNFSGTDFCSPIFKNVVFINCLFEKADLTDARTYGCSFIDCLFIKIDLRAVSIGARGGLYKNCVFDKCDFSNGFFYNPVFDNCAFNKCKLKSVDFKASAFISCKFIGKLSDVVFRGAYKDDMSPNAMLNPMSNVDFSEAIFGEYVGFDNCDLSDCVPPKGVAFSDILKPVDYMGDNYLSTTL